MRASPDGSAMSSQNVNCMSMPSMYGLPKAWRGDLAVSVIVQYGKVYVSRHQVVYGVSGLNVPPTAALIVASAWQKVRMESTSTGHPHRIRRQRRREPASGYSRRPGAATVRSGSLRVAGSTSPVSSPCPRHFLGRVLVAGVVEPVPGEGGGDLIDKAGRVDGRADDGRDILAIGEVPVDAGRGVFDRRGMAYGIGRGGCGCDEGAPPANGGVAIDGHDIRLRTIGHGVA